MMTTEKKAEKALLMAGHSVALFRAIVGSGRPENAVARLAAALTETPNADPRKRPTFSIDGDAVKAVIADHYADLKATDETTDKIAAENHDEPDTETDDE